MRWSGILAVAPIALFPVALCAQQMVSMQTTGDTAVITVRIKELTFTTVSGAPYSTKRITNGVQTRPDGTRIMQNQTALFYRDSAGRNHTEQQVAFRDSPYMVTIMDPILGCEYVLDPGNKIAHKLAGVVIRTVPVPAGKSQAMRIEAGTVTSADKVVTRTEDLGTRTILGMTAYGRKTTTTYPPGTHQGNDREVTAEFESWIAPAMGNLVVSSRTIEPGTLESNFSLADVVIGEPLASLFAPPPDYRVIEETSDFRISVPRNPAATVTKLSSHGVTPATIPNAPFSGSMRATGFQIQPDGSHLARPEQTTHSAWRDSQGRVRTEWPGRGIAPGGVEIKDPTSGYIYNLDFVNHVAYRSALSSQPAPATNAANADFISTSDSLGTQQISGVTANGVRTTTAPKAATGQRKVSEIWTARNEGVILLEKTTTGTDETTLTLKNFSTREPDPSQFQVPATYRILDEFGNQIQAKK